VGHGVEIRSRLKAFFDDALAQIELYSLRYKVKDFYFYVGSERAGKAILKGDLTKEPDQYILAIEFFADILRNHDGKRLRKRGMRAFLTDISEYHVLLPKALEKREKLRAANFES
jgi:hypothetical protein